MKREILVHTAESSNEMILEGLDGTFCRVSTMDARWNELKIHVFFVHEVFQKSRAFVVQSLESLSESCLDESRMDGFVCGENVLGVSCIHGLSKDMITVVVVQHQDVVVSMTGRDWKATSLIAVNLSFWRADVHDMRWRGSQAKG